MPGFGLASTRDSTKSGASLDVEEVKSDSELLTSIRTNIAMNPVPRGPNVPVPRLSPRSQNPIGPVLIPADPVAKVRDLLNTGWFIRFRAKKLYRARMTHPRWMERDATLEEIVAELSEKLSDNGYVHAPIPYYEIKDEDAVPRGKHLIHCLVAENRHLLYLQEQESSQVKHMLPRNDRTKRNLAQTNRIPQAQAQESDSDITMDDAEFKTAAGSQFSPVTNRKYSKKTPKKLNKKKKKH